jgi:Flp pilus assembly protein TadD
MQTISRLMKVLPAGACALALAACGKSQQQTYVIPEDAPAVDVKKLDAKTTALRLADGAYAKGEYAMAAQLYYRAAELQPENPEVVTKLGFALFKAGNAADAEKIFRAALEKNPKHPDALRGLAHSLVVQGRAADAVPIYRKALAAGAGDARIYAGLGAALDMIGKHQEARATYQAGLKVAPEDFGLRNNLALSYAMSGEGDKAKAILNGMSGDPATARKAQQSLSLVDTMTAKTSRPAPKREVAAAPPPREPAKPAKPADADRDTSRADVRDVAEVPPPRTRPAQTSRKANADVAVTDSGEGEIFIRTGRATVVHADTRRPQVAMTFKSDAADEAAAAAEVLDLLAAAERGPRFVWQEARRPE